VKEVSVLDERPPATSEASTLGPPTGISPASGRRRAAFAFIFITIFLDVLALGAIIPVLPKLISGFLDGDIVRTAKVLGAFGTLWALMQLTFSPLLGSLSDRFGRRPVILISNFGMSLDYVAMALAPTLGWLYVGRIVSGITAASISTAQAYVADVTPPEKRARAYGLLGAALGGGFILGPALGGLLGGFGPRVVFWVASGLSLANALYGLFVLPESLPPERRAALTWKTSHPISALRLLRADPILTGMGGVHFLRSLAHVVFPSVFVLYAGHRFGWHEREVGFALAGVGLSAMIVQALLVGRAVARFGERTTLIAGEVFGTLGMALYALAPSGQWFWWGVPLTSLWGLSNGVIQQLMTRRVQPGQQGQLQGAQSSLLGLANLLGPTLFAFCFARFFRDDPTLLANGAPFFLASVFLACSATVSVWATARLE
jgi:MFS transporter, DHA1 family, tetracycline resistance protein